MPQHHFKSNFNKGPKTQSLAQEGAFDATDRDIIIAVMGPTGTGKSNLIESFYPQGNMKIAREQLRSYTQSVSAYRLKDHPQHGNRVVFVDTPGFDDTTRSDMQVLKLIGEWLEKTYRKPDKVLLAGILYLHSIMETRWTGTINKNFGMFGQLCGEEAARNVILVSTFWDRAGGKEKEKALVRENELRTNYWKPLLDRESRMERFDNTASKADLILSRVVEFEKHRKLLHLQNELVDLGKPIRETDAGVTLYTTLQRILKSQRESLDSLMKEEASQADPQLLESLAKQRKDVEKQLQRSLQDLEELKVGFFQKLFSFLKFKKALSRAVALGGDF